MQRIKILFFIFVIIIGFASRSWAELKLTPSISIREEYNDNIFLTPNNEEDDFITSIYPAINLTYDTNLLNLSLDYGFNFRLYMHHSDQNETDLTNTQRAKLETTVSPYRNIFFVKVFDEYKRVTIDERRQVAIDNNFVNMTDSNRFLINPYLEYPLSGTLKTRIGYSYENIWYKAKEGDDAENHLGTVSLIKEISPKITTSLSYNYLLHRPKETEDKETEDKETEDYDRQDAILGINYQFSPKLTLNGEIGQTWFDFEKSEDRNTAIWNIQANYLLSEFITLSAVYSTSFLDSVNLGTYKSKKTAGTLSYNGKIPIKLTVFKSIGTYTSVDREDRSSGINIDSSIPIPITPELSGTLTGSYSSFTFLPQDEKVKRYRLGLSFGYALRITTVTFGYTHNWNNSTVDENDYKNNIIWAQARFTI